MKDLGKLIAAFGLIQLLFTSELSWPRAIACGFCLLYAFAHQYIEIGRSAMDGNQELRDELTSLKTNMSRVSLRLGMNGFDKED